MWTFLYGTLGLIVGLLTCTILFKVVPPIRFLFDNDMLGFGPMLVYLAVSSLSTIIGLVIGIRKDIRSGRAKGRSAAKTFLHLGFGAVILFVVGGSFFPRVPLFNPILFIKMFAFDLPSQFVKGKIVQMQNKSELKANPTLSSDSNGMAVGLGFAQEVQSVLLNTEQAIYISTNPETPFQLGERQLGPGIKLVNGLLDSTFSENFKVALQSAIGTPISSRPYDRTILKFEGEFTGGGILVRYGTKLFLISPQGVWRKDFAAIDDPTIRKIRFSPDHRFVYFGRDLVQYYNTSDKKPLPLIFRVDETGVMPKGDNFVVPKASSDNIQDFYVFPSGKIAVINGFNDGFSSLIDNTGKIYAQKVASGYVPHSKLIVLGERKVGASYRQQNEVSTITIITEDGIGPSDFPTTGCTSFLTEASLPVGTAGDFYVTGSFKCGKDFLSLLKFNSNMVRDSEFQQKEEGTIPKGFYFHSDGYGSSLSLDAQGNVYLANSAGGLVRFKPDGSFDTAFTDKLTSSIKGQTRSFTLTRNAFVVTGKFVAQDSEEKYLNIAQFSLDPTLDLAFLKEKH